MGLDPEARGDLSREEGDWDMVTWSNSMSFVAQADRTARHGTLCIPNHYANTFLTFRQGVMHPPWDADHAGPPKTFRQATPAFRFP